MDAFFDVGGGGVCCVIDSIAGMVGFVDDSVFHIAGSAANLIGAFVDAEFGLVCAVCCE